MDYTKIPSPCFVLDEAALRRNLAVVDRVRRESGAEIIVALKACAMWSIFPELARHSDGATASSLNEARLVAEEYGSPAHTYAPVYTERDFDGITRHSSHITFNSVAQFERFGARALLRGISCGLRVNPGWSPVETDLYNPALPGSRLGIERLERHPEGVEGLHFHVLCESGADDSARTLEAFGKRFGNLVPGLRWVNFGGGHLMTREGYDVELLIRTIKDFRARYPHLRVILEPGSAFTWRTGVLVSTVEDIVESGGVRTAMLDVSFACHMPDCLEMPYKPAIVGAHDTRDGERGWRMGGCSCLAGDRMGDWTFTDEYGDPRKLRVGDRVVFEDMIHYTMVKTTMFNGVKHPGIAIVREDGRFEIVREFGYEDYKNRMS
ncbi:MAG: carboxynorspermidine decarboxylase [Alistipes sp.]|jgi:carboxynorspermidine decarboxylase|nr:carboxynorspermidine decarboxylase [Alistipes sp.]